MYQDKVKTELTNRNLYTSIEKKQNLKLIHSKIQR